jgi:hypothetical protein
LRSEGILALTAVGVDPNHVAEVILDLEELIVHSVSPLVAGKIALLLHVHFRGQHYSEPPLFVVKAIERLSRQRGQTRISGYTHRFH